jgi:ADP-ribose pyrophosphatase YjhB (NUDIX family)
MPEKPIPRLGARAVILHEGRVLLLRAVEPGRTYYFLPGGHVKHGERAQEAAVREVLEETGLSVSIERALGVREFIAARHAKRPANMPAGHHVLAIIFLCKLEGSPEGRFQRDAGAGGVSGMEWIEVAKVAQLELHPPHLKTLLLSGLQDKSLHFWPEET